MNELALYYFHQGTTIKAYELLGAHYSKESTRFCVWAPNAVSVSVVGEFNNWNPLTNVMKKITNEGLYEVTIPNVLEFQCYQYAIKTKKGDIIYKSDPYAESIYTACYQKLSQEFKCRFQILYVIGYSEQAPNIRMRTERASSGGYAAELRKLLCQQI